jgi:Ni,Fe-hydrogenase I cytochrome b subunit
MSLAITGFFISRIFISASVTYSDCVAMRRLLSKDEMKKKK